MIESPRISRTAAPRCPLCERADVVHANALAFSRWEIFPLSPGHLLIIPVRHVQDFLAITAPEISAMWELTQKGRALIEHHYHPNGYNFGTDLSEAAGQKVAHAHLHLIPRYQCDAADPRGGVPAVVPARKIDNG